MAEPWDIDLEREYTPEEKRAMTKTARAAAKRERERDPNVSDPKGTQGRMDAAVHELRVKWGLER